MPCSQIFLATFLARCLLALAGKMYPITYELVPRTSVHRCSIHRCLYLWYLDTSCKYLYLWCRRLHLHLVLQYFLYWSLNCLIIDWLLISAIGSDHVYPVRNFVLMLMRNTEHILIHGAEFWKDVFLDRCYSSYISTILCRL